MYSKIFLLFLDIQPEILRRLNQILAKLNSIDDRLCKVEENQNITQKNKEISVLQELVTLPLKTNEELQNMEKDLENQDFFEQMVYIFPTCFFKCTPSIIDSGKIFQTEK